MTPWYFYLVSCSSRRLYAGITSDLIRRVREHKSGAYQNAFTARYNFDRLVYFEALSNQWAAARREKQVKGWLRAKKVALIEQRNPEWRDLSMAGDWGRLLGVDR